MKQQKTLKKLSCCGLVLIAFLVCVPLANAEDTLFMPSLTYRTGAYADSGIALADGYADYFNMLNERDGGIGGVKIIVEECETAFDTQRGVECYENTKDKGALAYSPFSTGITQALIAKASIDEIPILSMGYGLSAAAVGEKFPWMFVYPTTAWSQMVSILEYIDSKSRVKRRTIGFIYIDSDYGKEPLPLLENLSASMGFGLVKYPIDDKQVHNQSEQWINIRKDRPSWVIMWGLGAMNPAAVKEAIRNRYPLDRFIGNWLSGSDNDLKAVGKLSRGYLTTNFSGIGQAFPAIQDVLTHVVDKGLSQVASRDDVGSVRYNQGVFNAVMLAEAIKAAQDITGKTVITSADMRDGLENIDLDETRLKELGLDGFASAVKGSCIDHEGAGSVFVQQWSGDAWEKVSDFITPMNDTVRPLLEEAAEAFVSDHSDVGSQSCG